MEWCGIFAHSLHIDSTRSELANTELAILQDIRPIDVENTTYEAILSVLQLATADKNGAESVIQHYDQLIIVSMTRPIDSPKDKRVRAYEE